MNCLDEAHSSQRGQLLQRALDLRNIIKAGVQVTLKEIDADELYAMLVIEEEQNRLESEKINNGQS